MQGGRGKAPTLPAGLICNCSNSNKELRKLTPFVMHGCRRGLKVMCACVGAAITAIFPGRIFCFNSFIYKNKPLQWPGLLKTQDFVKIINKEEN